MRLLKTKLGTSGFCATLQMQNVEIGHERLFLFLAFENGFDFGWFVPSSPPLQSITEFFLISQKKKS